MSLLRNNTTQIVRLGQSFSCDCVPKLKDEFNRIFSKIPNAHADGFDFAYMKNLLELLEITTTSDIHCCRIINLIIQDSLNKNIITANTTKYGRVTQSAALRGLPSSSSQQLQLHQTHHQQQQQQQSHQHQQQQQHHHQQQQQQQQQTIQIEEEDEEQQQHQDQQIQLGKLQPQLQDYDEDEDDDNDNLKPFEPEIVTETVRSIQEAVGDLTSQKLKHDQNQSIIKAEPHPIDSLMNIAATYEDPDSDNLSLPHISLSRQDNNVLPNGLIDDDYMTNDFGYKMNSSFEMHQPNPNRVSNHPAVLFNNELVKGKELEKIIKHKFREAPRHIYFYCKYQGISKLICRQAHQVVQYPEACIKYVEKIYLSNTKSYSVFLNKVPQFEEFYRIVEQKYANRSPRRNVIQ